MKNFFTSIPNLLLTFTLCFVLSSCSSTGVKMSESSPWETIQFEDQSNALDIDFIDNNHGFLVGSNRLIMESNDGGKSWDKRSLDIAAEENFRLLDIDFKGSEGWLIGQPSLVMHTIDEGKNWTRLSLGKLPGQPFLVSTVDDGVAELATTSAAIYITLNSGETWEAKVSDPSEQGGISCLLYTSPSPRDLSTSRMPSSA